MTSKELTSKRDSFVTNVDTFKNKFNEINTKVTEIDNVIKDTYDTVLSNFLVEQNTKIKEKVEKFCNGIEEKKNAIVKTVDAEIAKLKNAEEEAAKKAAEEAKKKEETIGLSDDKGAA